MKKWLLLITLFLDHAIASEIPKYEISAATTKAVDNIISAPLNDSMTKKLTNMSNRLNSDEFKQEQNKYRLRAAKILGTDQYLDKEEIELDRSAKVIVFISESVPLPTLRNYAAALDKVGGALIMRGMIGGMTEVRPTALFSSEILKIDSSCKQNCRFFKTQVLIDPLLFRKYNIKSVPAISVQKGVQLQTYCHAVDEIKVNDTVVYGDVSIKYALGRYLEQKPDDDVEFLLGKM